MLLPEEDDWRSRAACAGKLDLFFPPARHFNYAWERNIEPTAKKMCAGCSVVDECLTVGLTLHSAPGHRDFELIGVFGGTNRYERRWLRSRPEEAVALSRSLSKQGIDPQELAEYGLVVGPPDFDHSLTVADACDKWGVAIQVVHRWANDRGVSMAKPSYTPWGKALRDILAAEPTKWHPRARLIEATAGHIPESRIEDKQRLLQQRGRKSTPQIAAERIIDGVIRTGVRRGHFERRNSPVTNKAELRMARSKWAG